MRHVTDGELHAFLDGALDLLPDGRGEEIRDHVSRCPVCRERLQDEEHLRDEAEGILVAPDLRDVELPTFEELRDRAEAPIPEPVRDKGEKIHYRGPLKGLPLAWAATIVLALGVGWMGGQVFRTLPPGGRLGPPSGDLEAVRPAEAGIEEQLSVSSLREDSRAQEAAGEQLPAPPREDAAGPEEASGQPPETEGVAVTDEMLKVLATPLDSPSAAPSPSTLEFAALQQRQGVERALLRSVTDTDSLEHSFAIPGLKVASIDWEERVPGERALLVRQLLSPGDTLELRYLGLLLGAESEPLREVELIPAEEGAGRRTYANILEASLPPGWAQVVMERERGLLIARGPIDEDQLKALLKTIR